MRSKMGQKHKSHLKDLDYCSFFFHSCLRNVYQPCWTLFRLCCMQSPKKKTAKFSLRDIAILYSSIQITYQGSQHYNHPHKEKITSLHVFSFENYGTVTITFQAWLYNICPCISIDMFSLHVSFNFIKQHFRSSSPPHMHFAVLCQ